MGEQQGQRDLARGSFGRVGRSACTHMRRIRCPAYAGLSGATTMTTEPPSALFFSDLTAIPGELYPLWGARTASITRVT